MSFDGFPEGKPLFVAVRQVAVHRKGRGVVWSCFDGIFAFDVFLALESEIYVLGQGPAGNSAGGFQESVLGLFELLGRVLAFDIGLVSGGSAFGLDAAGGVPVRLTKFESGKHTTHRWPVFLPDGKHFLFFATNHSGGSEQGIYIGSLDDGSYKHVLDSDSGAEYASGYLLYHMQQALLAQKFDPNTGAVSGDPMPVANFVEYDTGTWHTTFTVSQNGLLIYETGTKALGTDLFWRDRSGKLIKQVGERGFYKGAGRISPDGKRLAVGVGDPQADIWVFDLERGARTRLTFGGATHLMPSWSADGKRVAYVRQNGTTVVTGTSLRARLARVPLGERRDHRAR